MKQRVIQDLSAFSIHLVYISSIINISIIAVFLAKATFEAIAKTYEYLTPDLWSETKFTKVPYQEFTDFLAKPVLPKAAPASQPEQTAPAPAGKGF